jgi:hypothetical protein
VPRPKNILKGLIVRALNIPVTNEKGDRSSGRLSSKDPRKNLHLVFFLARRSPWADSRPAPVELLLKVIGGQFQAGRASVHDSSNGRSVRLAPGGYPKENP